MVSPKKNEKALVRNKTHPSELRAMIATAAPAGSCAARMARSSPSARRTARSHTLP